jgi:hypothetical protein
MNLLLIAFALLLCVMMKNGFFALPVLLVFLIWLILDVKENWNK